MTADTRTPSDGLLCAICDKPLALQFTDDLLTSVCGDCGCVQAGSAITRVNKRIHELSAAQAKLAQLEGTVRVPISYLMAWASTLEFFPIGNARTDAAMMRKMIADHEAMLAAKEDK